MSQPTRASNPVEGRPADVAPGEAKAAGAWASTLDSAGAARWLGLRRSAVLLTHAKPDGDAAGSTLALARTLSRCGVDARVMYVSPVPRWLPVVAGGTPYTVLDARSGRVQPALEAMHPDAVIVTDTGSWPQLDEVRPWLEARRDRTLVIDHHLHGDADVSADKFLGLGEASTTLVLAPLCCRLLECEENALPLDVAEPIYLGLATDTQWFKLSNVSAKALRTAGNLLEAGVVHTKLYELIEQQDAASRWKLLGRALSSLELHDGGRIAIMRLLISDFTCCDADRNDTSGFADMVLHIASVQVAVVLTEAESAGAGGATTKVSMRSKPGPSAVDVNRVTMSLGGGGHARAAGAKMVGVGIDAARDRVLGALRGCGA